MQVASRKDRLLPSAIDEAISLVHRLISGLGSRDLGDGALAKQLNAMSALALALQ